MSDCSNLPASLVACINDINNYIVDTITSTETNMQYICVQEDITYTNYFNMLSSKWNAILSSYEKGNNCGSLIKLINLNPTKAVEKFKTIIKTAPETFNKYINDDEKLSEFIISTVIPAYTSNSEPFKMSEDGIQTMKSLAKVIYNNCACDIHNIFKSLLSVYSVKINNLPRDQLKSHITHLFSLFRTNIRGFLEQNYMKQGGSEEDLKDTFIYNELSQLIPDSLGALKEFFLIVISAYYNKLHPIIWAQIVYKAYHDFFTTLPITQDDFFTFGANKLLTNSGPFILKILQMITPALKDIKTKDGKEVLDKYGLRKLKYPMLTPDQANMVLKKVCYNFKLMHINFHISASMGHVCMAQSNLDPNDKFIIKIIKPVSLAQTCWEYKTLKDVFPTGTCERDYVVNVIESNGKEMNLLHEIENINKANALYKASYSELFGTTINAHLDTIKVRDDIVVPGKWYAMAMTLAPGLPIIRLIEEGKLLQDNVYRANLHRCLDLFVFKFFHTIVQDGFYHGDPHGGNLFYSYSRKTVTLIDFGAVGHLNIYQNDENTKAFIKIIIMSLFYNYDGILDFLTDILNSKCSQSSNNKIIDKASPEYKALMGRLVSYKHENIKNKDADSLESQERVNKLFSEDRINKEHYSEPSNNPSSTDPLIGREEHSVYQYYDIMTKRGETVEDYNNRTNILLDEEVKHEDKNKVSLNSVLTEIFTFYANNGVNVAIKFSEFYDFQKAYALMLGVLMATGYSSYRVSMAISKGIKSMGNLMKLITSPSLLMFIVRLYSEESRKFKEIVTGQIVKDNTEKLAKLETKINEVSEKGKKEDVKTLLADIEGIKKKLEKIMEEKNC